MTLKPVLTYFARAAQPANLLTVGDWRRFGQEQFGRAMSHETAARKHAAMCGGALVLTAPGALICFTKRADGKISRRTYRPGKWAWEV